MINGKRTVLGGGGAIVYQFFEPSLDRPGKRRLGPYSKVIRG